MHALLWPFVHFAALLGFIVYKAKTPFGQFIKTRHQEVVTGLNRSKVQAAEAAQKKVEIESMLRGMDGEKQSIVAEWKEREIQQIQAIKESTQRILAQIKIDAELNRKSLEATVRADAARAFGRLVFEKAEQKLKSSMTAETHKKINDEFTKELMGA